MEPEKLMEVTAQVLTAGVDRDASSGWGGVVGVVGVVDVWVGVHKDKKIKNIYI